MPLASGATFAGYTILRLIGRGGMSEVYRAQPFVATRTGEVAPGVIVADPRCLWLRLRQSQTAPTEAGR